MVLVLRARTVSITLSERFGLLPLEFVKFAHTAGELSPDLHGRGDLEGFDLGYRDGLNMLVDWRGGLRTRPGTVMCEPLFEDEDHPGVRLSTFSFNTDSEDNYLLVWKHNQLFFIQDGRYLYDTQHRQIGNSLTDVFNVGDIVLVFTDNSGFLGDYLFTGKAVSYTHLTLPTTPYV